VDAILYIVRGGIPWRQLPVEFPPAGTVYAVFARWARGGAWQRILDALRDRLRVRAERDRCPTAAIIDSQTVPAADTVPRSSRGWDGGKRMNGVKRHIAVDVNGLLLTVVVTAASIPDRDAAHRLAWINKHRRCARDYETRPAHHEAMVHLAMITTMTRRLART